MNQNITVDSKATPLVSVIVRTKDRTHSLSEALKSIVSQAYANIEIVVINDGGYDVKELVQNVLGNALFIYVRHETCRGRAAAANSGLTSACGRYINFLDDDDILYPEHLETLVAFLETRAEKVAYSSVLNVHFAGPLEDPGMPVRDEMIFNQDFDPDKLLFENYIPMMSVLFSKSILEKVGGFDEDLELFEDWDFWMRLSRHFVFHHLDKVTAEYRFYDDKGMQLSHNLKYEYNSALAKMFERAMPFINGKVWLNFLDQGMVGRLRHELKKILLDLTLLQKKHAELYEAHQRSSQWGHGLQSDLEALQQDYSTLVKANEECAEWGHGLQSDLEALQQDYKTLVKANEECAQWGHVLQSDLEALQQGYNTLVKANEECAQWGHGLQSDLEALQQGYNTLVKANEECAEWGHGLQSDLEALHRDHADLLEAHSALHLDNAVLVEAHERCSAWGHGLQSELEALHRDHADLLEVHSALHLDNAVLVEAHERCSVWGRGLQSEIEKMRRSISWRITAPLRWAKKAVFSAVVFSGKVCFRALRGFFRHLPLTESGKYELKSFSYQRFGWLFQRTLSYRLWESARAEFSKHPPMSLSFSVQAAAPKEYLCFPQSSCPEISVVILLSSCLDNLFQSLKALSDACAGYAYEVIAVDAQPGRENRALLSMIDGWRLVRAGYNLSIVDMLRLGADNARGQYLAFCVGDLLLLPGWLDEMFRSFREQPEIGLVGSQINLRDGTLWEAGGTINEDGGAYCVGRGANAAQPEFNYLREVDFCSAISFMIPADLFKQTGWDTARDCDSSIQIGMQLSVSVRSAGRKVCYNPLSKVVILSMPGENEWNEKYLKGVFQLDSAGFDPKIAKECGQMDKAVVPAGQILFIDVRTPTPDQDSGSQDIVSYFKIFRSLGFEITFIPAADLQFMEKYTPDLQRMGVQCLYTPFVRGITEYLESHGQGYDLALLYKVHCAAYYLDFVKQYCPKAKIIFDTVDLHYVREQRQAVIEKSQEIQKNAQKTKILELSVIRKADCTIVLSTEEREILLREPDIIEEKIAVVPLIREIPGRGNPFQARKDILFVGGFEHRPNVDAMLTFVHDIWPLIKKDLPELAFYILGSKPPKEILDLAGEDVIVTGYVSDLSPYFNNCRLSIAPLRYGAGLKGKVATSLSYGLPCVASSSAVEGSGLKRGEEIIVADAPDEFAKAVVDLYLNAALWNDLSDRGLDFMNLAFSFAAGRQKLEHLLCDLGVTKKRGFSCRE